METTDAILQELKELARSMMLTTTSSLHGGAGGGKPAVKFTKTSTRPSKGSTVEKAAAAATSPGGTEYASQQAFIETVNRRAQAAFEQLHIASGNKENSNGSSSYIDPAVAASANSAASVPRKVMPSGGSLKSCGSGSVARSDASFKSCDPAASSSSLLSNAFTTPANHPSSATTMTTAAAATTSASSSRNNVGIAFQRAPSAGNTNPPSTSLKSIPTPLNASSITSDNSSLDQIMTTEDVDQKIIISATAAAAARGRRAAPYARDFEQTGTNDNSEVDDDDDEEEEEGEDEDDVDDEKRTDDAEGGAAADEDEDLDGSTFDGVRTLVLFLKADSERFRHVSEAMWHPEDVDTTDGAVSTVLIPFFPFGGGTTDVQDRRITAAFNELVANERQLRVSRGEVRYVSKDALDRRAFEDVSKVPEEESRRWGRATTDFVVKADASIIFDASSAKITRREQMLAKRRGDTSHNGEIHLRVLMDPFRTGFEEEKEYPIVPGNIVAGRYQIIDLLGQATFSRAVRCFDLEQPIYDEEEEEEEGEENEDGAKKGDRRIVTYHEVCLKVINNTKEFFDQSLDEIRLLNLINARCDPDEAHVVRLIDYFYHKEHMFLVTELLSDNLYEFSKYDREHEGGQYFTLNRLQSITRQITEALAYVHSLDLLHCDLKPENILFVSHSRCIIKVIDFGSSCFISDHLSSYIQSRSYRAPEVILGADYDGRIDVWSLGAILAELVTGDVLFAAETVAEMLSRIVAICGAPFPRALMWEGRHTQDFITKFGAIYEVGNKEHDENAEESFYLYTPVFPTHDHEGNLVEDPKFVLLRSKLAACGMVDPLFISFVECCLELDHKKRKTSAELLKHPFLHASYDQEDERTTSADPRRDADAVVEDGAESDE